MKLTQLRKITHEIGVNLYRQGNQWIMISGGANRVETPLDYSVKTERDALVEALKGTVADVYFSEHAQECADFLRFVEGW